MRDLARRLAVPLLEHGLTRARGRREIVELLPPSLAPLLDRILDLYLGETAWEKRGGVWACRLCGKLFRGRRGLFMHLVRAHRVELEALLETILREEVERLGF